MRVEIIKVIKTLMLVCLIVIMPITYADNKVLKEKPQLSESKIITQSSAHNLAIHVSLSYEAKDGDNLSQQNQMETLSTIASNDSRWLVIGDQESRKNVNSILLIAKIEKAKAKLATLRFLVLGLDKKAHFIFEPRITVHYGQMGKLKLEENNRKVEVNVLVNKV